MNTLRRACLGLVLLALAWPVTALGKLVQPDGSAVALGEVKTAEGLTLLFPSSAVADRSWLSLPEGSVPTSITLVWSGGRATVTVPEVRLSGLRWAFTVPAGLLSVTVRGRVETSVVTRSLERPDTKAPWITLSAEGTRLTLPPWRGAATPQISLVRRTPGPWEARFSEGDQIRSFGWGPADLEGLFSPEAWGLTPQRVDVPGDPGALAAIRFRSVAPEEPIPAHPTEILAWPSDRWRTPDREWFAWHGTSVLVLVTRDYGLQDAYLKRLAFFVEKTGYRGRLVTDDEVEHLHAWNAHDYAAPDLARFFTLALQTNFPLNDAEVELRDRLEASGILKGEGNGWTAGTGALVGISQESPPALRAALFVHEGYHGLYFTSPTFREGVRTAWMGLSEGARDAFRAYLARSRYDPSDEGLMVNEFQAYVLQRVPREWGPFFSQRVLVDRGEPEASRWLSEFLTASEGLNALVGRLYGLSSGLISSVRGL